MKERPILFNSEMVKAVLEGRKTQTRRVIKPKKKKYEIIVLKDGVFSAQRIAGLAWHIEAKNKHNCPYGQVGDRLWVRETFKFYEFPASGKDVVEYAAGGIKDFPNEPNLFEGLNVTEFDKNYPSIFMPRWASRINLEITNIRVERVQEITDAGAVAEGIDPKEDMYDGHEIPKVNFSHLWDDINEKRGFGWDVNPWVWVVKFKKVEGE